MITHGFRSPSSRAAVAIGAVCLMSCTEAAAGPPPVPGPFREIASPGGTGSQAPNLSAARAGPLLSWLAPADGGSAEDDQVLRVSRLTGEDWSEPRTVVRRSDLFVNWADFPSVLELADGRLVAHWLQFNGPGTYAYQVRLSFSTDEGRSWSESIVPHESLTQTEHGFVALSAAPGGVDAVWLDGRAYETDQPQMSLRHAFVASDGTVGPETVLDPRTCDCCQNSSAITTAGQVVAYRGRTEDEVRDINVVRRIDGRWLEPVRVHDDGWRIPACPVNGPAIVASGLTVFVTWFTAARDSARVLGARSTDGGLTFSAPVRIDEGRPIGRVDAVVGADGRVFVSWLEALGEESGAEVRVRSVDRQGRSSPSVSVGPSSASRASGFPVLALDDGRLLVAWTDPDDRRVRVAVGPLED